MDELMGEFVAETRETLDHIAEALVAWEAQPNDASRLDAIFRFVHTVKGSCGFLDLPRIEALAHAAETALAGVRDGTRTPDSVLVGTMLAIIDRIAELVAALDDPNATIPDPTTDLILLEALERRTAIVDAFDPVAARQARTVRVAVPILEAMMNQISDLVLVRNELARSLRSADNRELDDGFARLSGIVGDLRDSVTRTRMQPIDRLFSTLPRLVRDTAHDVGKTVVLDITGHDVEIDREMVEALRDPLVHIVRNAIDHGIEKPLDRRACGKSEVGVLRIVALQAGNQVTIEISDDGRGLDVPALIAKAVATKRIDAAGAAALSDSDAANLIFEAGISTAASVTTISGRGVGMDVVRANVERLGGSVDLANRLGHGLTITIRAPLTLSIVNALVVRSAGQSFAIPRAAIEEVVAFGKAHAHLDTIGGDLLAVVRGEAISAFSLADLLGLDAPAPQLAVLIETPGDGRYALAVDQVGNHEELVVRPMAPQTAACGLYAGQSLGDDGAPLAVLDTIGLAARAGLVRAVRSVRPVDEVVARAPSVLIATALDGRRIAVRAALIERLIETRREDWVEVEEKWFVVIDGRHCAAVADGALPMTGQIFTLMLADGSRRVAYAVAAAHDLAPLPAQPMPVGAHGVEGLFQHEGMATLLLEGLGLFANVTAAVARRPVAALALERTPWAQALLAPLVAAAGYDVRFGDDGVDLGAADLVLRIEGDAIVSPTSQADRYDTTAIKTLLAGAGRTRT